MSEQTEELREGMTVEVRFTGKVIGNPGSVLEIDVAGCSTWVPAAACTPVPDPWPAPEELVGRRVSIGDAFVEVLAAVRHFGESLLVIEDFGSFVPRIVAPQDLTAVEGCGPKPERWPS